jgi:hypothetical protein
MMEVAERFLNQQTDLRIRLGVDRKWNEKMDCHLPIDPEAGSRFRVPSGILPRIFTLFAILLSGSVSSGQEITLKQRFFDWQFSTDGANFQSAGLGGDNLKPYFAGNEPALKELQQYRSNALVSLVNFGVATVAIGIPTVAYTFGSEWKSSFTALMIGGGALVITGISFDNSAKGHIREAVRIHNARYKATASLPLTLDVSLSMEPSRLSNDRLLLLSANLRF